LIQNIRKPNLVVTTAFIGRAKEDGGNIVGFKKDLQSSLASESVTDIKNGRIGSVQRNGTV
jgi:hypothetical protein